jgi:hypothetical protein
MSDQRLKRETMSIEEATISIEVKLREDVFAYIDRLKGSFDQTLYQHVIGASNAFKEGDETIGGGPVMKKRGRMHATFCQTQ